jgi:hypothetical protein
MFIGNSSNKIIKKNSKYSSAEQLVFTLGMKFEDDGRNLIFRKPGSTTLAIKIPWTTP